jgi:hypothetical protein
MELLTDMRSDHECSRSPKRLRKSREARSGLGDRGDGFAFDAACLNVRCCPHCGLKPDIAPSPKSANKRHQLEMKEAAN